MCGCGTAFAADVDVTANSTTVDLDANTTGSTIQVFSGVTVTGGINVNGLDGATAVTRRVWMLTNQGTITGGNTVVLEGGASVMNAAGASITGVGTGLIIGYKPSGLPPAGGPGTVDNYGTITGGVEGVTLWFGGTVNNYFGGTIKTDAGVNAVTVGQGTSRTLFNSGTIQANKVTGLSTGVLMQGGPSTFTNTATGVIFGDYNGVYASATAVFTSFDNAGSITSNRSYAVEATGGGTLTNSGIIRSAQTGVLFGAGSITNSGTIGSTGSGRSILFTGAGTHTLNLLTGSVLIGDVQGGTGIDNLVLKGVGTESLTKFLAFETLSMQGSDWTLTGARTFTTSADVQSGVMRVNGDLTTPTVTVAAGGTLAGSGTVTASGGATINGNIAPGNSIGTLNIVGPYTQAAGSTYTVEVDTSPASDLINVTGAAVIQAGATVNVLAAPGFYTLGQRYTILTASLGVTGQFATLTDNAPFVDFVLDSDANNIYLDVMRSSVSFAQIARTANQRAAARGDETLGPGNTVFDALVMLDMPNAQRAFDALSGEGHATARSLLVDESRFIRDAVTARLRQWSGGANSLLAPFVSAFRLDASSEAEEALAYAAKAPVRPLAMPASQPRYFTAWGQLLGNWGETSGDGNAARSTRSTGGLIAGTDLTLDETWRLGVATGHQRTSFDIGERATTGGINTYHVAAYAGAQRGPLALRAGAAYAWHDLETTRQVVFPGFADRLSGNYDATTGQAFAEIGYTLAYAGTAFEPYAALAHARVSTSPFTEAGGPAALTAAGASDSVTYTTLGVRAAAAVPLFNAMTTTLRGGVGWRHAFGDRLPLTTFAFNGGTGTPFTVAAVPIAADALALEAGLDAQVTSLVTLGVTYVGQVAGRARDHSLKGSLTARF